MTDINGLRCLPDIAEDTKVVRYIKSGTGNIQQWGLFTGETYNIALQIKQKPSGWRKFYTWIKSLQDVGKTKGAIALLLFFTSCARVFGFGFDGYAISAFLSVAMYLFVHYISIISPEYFQPLITAKNTFVVYRNMDTNEFKRTIQAVFWQFDTKKSKTWPNWIKNADGTKVFSFSSLVVTPELFHSEEGNEQIFQLQTCTIGHLNLNKVAMKSLRKAWSGIKSDVFGSMHSVAMWATKHWLRFLILLAIAAETLNVSFALAGVETFAGHFMGVMIKRLAISMTTLASSPIKTLYRTGPAFNGYGFWANRPLAEICTAMMPRFDRDFWETNMDKCLYEYEAKEDAFVLMFIFAMSFIAFQYLMLVSRNSKRR